MADLALDAADGEVHVREAPRGVVGLLAVDADVGAAVVGARGAVARGVLAEELHGLDEHARRATARVVDAAVVGLDHLDEGADDAAGRVELAALLALGAGELAEEVLVDAAEDVGGAGGGVADRDVADQVDELAERLLVEALAGVLLGEHVLEGGVVALDGGPSRRR